MRGKKTIAVDPLTENEMDMAVFSSYDAIEAILKLFAVVRKNRLGERTCLMAGISHGCISAVLLEKRMPRLDTVIAILNALGYDLKVIKL